MAMDRSAAEAYIYAKVCGMLSKSFIGKKAAELFNPQSLKELWSLLFKKDCPAMPEKLLARELEIEAQNKLVSQYNELICLYSKPDEILIALLHFFDYKNLKRISSALCFNENKMPGIINISPYNLLNYEKWPDIAEMTENNILSWYNQVPKVSEQKDCDLILDCQYMKEVWEGVKKLPLTCRTAVENLIGFNFSIENILWALRLKIYYKMEKEEIVEKLSFVQGKKDETDPAAGEALKILDWEVNDFERWSKWKYARFINPHEEGVRWSVDPKWIYNASRKEYVNEAYYMFRQYPFSVCPLICWFIIKQNELDNIRTASECLKMNESAETGMLLAGITEEKNG